MQTAAPLQLLDDDFIAILACPGCRGSLQTEEHARLACENCKRSYPVEDGIPILVLEHTESAEQLEYQRSFFNEQFEAVREYRLLNWHQSYLTRIFSATCVDQKPSGRYLDIGSGGIAYTVIEAARRGWHAVGCDLSIEGIRNAIQFARAQGVEERTRFVVCSAEALPFKNSSFDAISCIAVLEHLVRDDLAAKEIGRVSK
jgi:ubiquinone/menaquinone biosynthesis C-methylase UbiE